MTEELYRATFPVFKVDGEVKGELARDITRLEIDETTEGLKTLTARFIAFGAARGENAERVLYLDGRVLDFGKALEVSLGAPSEARTVFKGAVSAIEASYLETREPEVVVFAEDKLMKLRMTRRMRTYRDKSDADIASEIAGLHGLQPDVAAEGPTYDVVQQWNQSDLAFLRARAALVQAELWLEDDRLCFKNRRQQRARTEVTLVRGGRLIEVHLRADLAHQRTKVKVSGYDASAKDKVEEEAGGDAVAREVESGRSGPSVLESAFGERVSYRVREVPLTSQEARAFAAEEMCRRARGFVVASGTSDGTPDLVVGSRLTLENVGAPFEGPPYHVTRVLHTYDREHGHRTHFEAERPTLGNFS
jgi:phage protein D